MIGKMISHYKILEKLGAGGMGVVYKAEDTRLKRIVALKFLPHGMETLEPEKARFLQEAQAASALNHPNACTIYDIHEEGQEHFIVMEYVDGRTLKSMVPVRKMQDAVAFAVQIGEALQEAHAHGIVHRDVKTENIMVNAKNHVKVMDFGLAKLKGSLKLTKTSSTVGTLAYMSPEQIQGGEVDSRSDLFSFGVVLYEMFTGHLPFRGEHEAAMMYSILNEEPASLYTDIPDIPPELVHIVNTAMEKDPNDRYQSAADVVRDLRRVQRQTFRVVRPSMEGPPQGKAEKKIAPPKAFRKLWIPVTGIILIAAAAGLYRLFHAPESSPPVSDMKFDRLTTTGKVIDAVLSPEERFIVYSQREKGKQSLWMRQIATASTIQILPPRDVLFQGLTLSRDGNYLYYVVQEIGNPLYSLYKIPLLGGPAKKLLDDVQSPVSLSPDGKQFTFTRFYPKSGEFALMVANEDGSGDRILASHKADKWFTNKPSWSPDGKTIVCPMGNWEGGFHHTPMAVQVNGGGEKPVTTRQWRTIKGVEWLHDGSGLVAAGIEKGSSLIQLWSIATKSGKVRRITNDLNDYPTVSLTPGSRTLCTVQSEVRFNLWMVPQADASKAVQITSGTFVLHTIEEGLTGMAFTPDGRILFANQDRGNDDIWICDADGGNQRQLTAEPSMDITPAVSQDGRTVFFVSDRSGIPNIWRMQSDGSRPQQLTFGGEDYYPRVSPDGRWLYFYSWDAGPALIMRIPVEGGEPKIVFGKGASFYPEPSPDGKWLAFVMMDDQRVGRPQVCIIPSTGGAVVKTFDIPTTATISSNISFQFQWTHDSRAVSYIDTREDVSNIWMQALSGGKPRQLTGFKSGLIFLHAWSPDGTQLAVARGERTSDAVLIRNFR